MALQFSSTVRNNMLDAIETTVGLTPILRVYDGALPVDAAAAAAGTVLAEITMPSDWLAAATGGTKTKSGTWQDLSANADGTAAYFRIYDSTATTCHLQGVVTPTGGGGDLTVNSTNFRITQQFTISSFILVAGNA